MCAASCMSVALQGATRPSRYGVRGLCVYSLEVAALRRSWHSASSVVLCQSVTSVCGGGKACGWITRGPGQHHGHCYTASPALRVSYTTVYVPAYRSFHTSVRLWEKEFSPQAASSTTSQKMVPPPESERNSNVKVKEKETLKPSSQVEVTVKDLKEKAKAAGSPIVQDKKLVRPRKTLGERIKDEILHYYHGFRLLFIDTKICCKYVWRIVNGENLSRREHRQLVRTTSDLFRLVPFSVFVIVPFMEFLLPVALKLFPGMLPSTFETANEKEAKMKKKLKMKLEMAKFLQQTLDSMAVEAKGRSSERAKEFVSFFEKITKSGEQVSNEEILKFSKLFEDEITLDSMTRPQLVALCRLLEMQPFGTNNFLRFQLRLKLRSLAADDKIIEREGLDSLAVWELQQACRARGMRAYGLSEERLRLQLTQWLELSLQEKVPPSLLLLSRTLYLPETVRASDTLAATISSLPEEVATRTKAAIGKREGKIDNLTRLEVIQAEERKIAEDKEELKILEEEKKQKLAIKKAAEEALKATEETPPEVIPSEVEMAQLSLSTNKILTEGVQVTKATVSASGEIQEAKAEELIDKAPTLKDKAEVLSEEMPKPSPEPAVSTEQAMLTSEDLRDVEEAIENLGVEKRKLIIEEQEMAELKSELADYQEDIEDFRKALTQAKIDKKQLRVSKAAGRLFVRVNKMINRMEPLLDRLGKEKAYRQKIVDAGEAKDKTKAELVSLQDLSQHLNYICHASDTSKVALIHDVLAKMDFDKDGAVEVEHVLHVLNLMIDEQVGVTPKLFEEVVEMLAKEDQLESAQVIQHALNTTITDAQNKHSQADTTFDIPESSSSNKTPRATSEQCDKNASVEGSENTETEKQAKRSQ
ncbi:mitochondrial proton/calcium exchanger protein-like isoform X2 [Portunus trituberculatus]|uniref:mitochondrial proton/calcium exchanger protein-like isoform X2 n=1 Tax=Portunus trituberculatus TaxID=210409 RepID=UPI001E1CCFCD|nr:mitochondrial proton/calcium exchanger protein-like isoform X2 [Portunus trituberculatus]